MKLLALAMLLLGLAGCATLELPKPLTSDEVIALAKSGAPQQQVIEELKRTGTVLPLTASEIVRLHQAGVPRDVLDHLQRAQIDEIRWREHYSSFYRYGPLYRGFGPCPWPDLWPYGPRTRPWVWGC